MENNYFYELRKFYDSLKKGKIILGKREIAYISTDNLENINKRKTIVYIHGWLVSKEIWVNVMHYIWERQKDWVQIAVDVLGHGESSKYLDDNYSIRAMAETIRHALYILGINEYEVVGLSMGGAISGFLSYIDNRVKKLIFIDGIGTSKAKTLLSTLLKIIQKEPLITLIALTMNPLYSYFFLKKYVISKKGWEKILEYMRNFKDIVNTKISTSIKGLHNKLVARKFSKELFKETFDREFMEVGKKKKVVVIWGKEDNLVKPEAGEYTAELFNTNVNWIEDSAHIPFLENPEQCLPIILQGLSETT